MEQDTNTQRQKRKLGSILQDLSHYDLFILVLTIFAMIVMVGILWPGNPVWEPILYWTDLILCAVFLFDFLLLLRRAPNKIDYFVKQWGWLDLLGSIPAVPGFKWTALYRLGRLNRPVQMARNQRTQRKDETTSKAGENTAGTILMSMIVIMIMLLTITSLLVLRVERGADGARILTGAEAFWWAFVTMTTVGYGDYVPITHSGRILALILMTFGIGVFAVLTSFLASKFAIAQDDQEDLRSLIKEENARLHEEIAELRTLITEQRK
jgi:voltage-gated potassium channel